MYSQRRKNNQERWLTESGDPANDLIALQDSTPQLDWRYFVIELWIYVNPTSEQKGDNLFFHVKEFAQLLIGVPTKIIQLLIAPVDYQGSNFSVFSSSRPNASPSKKTNARNARESTQTKIPLLSLCFHSVFMFLFVFQLKELQRVGLTQGRKRWSVLVNQSVNESEMAQ